MARVINYRQPRTEDDRDEMSPVAVGVTIGVGAISGLALGLAVRSALSDAEAPFEASREAIAKVEAFENEDGDTFSDHALRGAGLAAALTAAPFAKIPTDLDIKGLPAAIPASPEAVVDYLEDHLEMEVSPKQAKKIRSRFEKLELEFEKRGDGLTDAKVPTDEVDEEEDDEEEEE